MHNVFESRSMLAMKIEKKVLVDAIIVAASDSNDSELLLDLYTEGPESFYVIAGAEDNTDPDKNTWSIVTDEVFEHFFTEVEPQRDTIFTLVNYKQEN